MPSSCCAWPSPSRVSTRSRSSGCAARSGRAAPARGRAELPGLPRLVRARLPGPPLRPPDPRHAREHGGHRPRRLATFAAPPRRPRPARGRRRRRHHGRGAGAAARRRLRRPARTAERPELPAVAPRIGAVEVVRLADPAERGRVRPGAGLQRHDPDYYAGLRRQLHPGRRRLQLAAASRRCARSAASPTRPIPTSRARQGALVAGRGRHQQPAGGRVPAPSIRRRAGPDGARRARRDRPRQRPHLPHRLVSRCG